MVFTWAVLLAQKNLGPREDHLRNIFSDGHRLTIGRLNVSDDSFGICLTRRSLVSASHKREGHSHFLRFEFCVECVQCGLGGARQRNVPFAYFCLSSLTPTLESYSQRSSVFLR